MRTETQWQELISRGPSSWPLYQRVDNKHPIDFYVGINSEGARLLMLVADHEPPQPPSFRSFEVIKAKRADNKWTVSVILRQTEFGNVFSHLCDDLLTSSKTESTPARSAEYLISRLLRWQKLLGKDRSALLSIEAIRGLVGELAFLREIALPRLGDYAAVNSWEGPYDASQDFKTLENFYEVKTCGPSSLVVWISSAEQLDSVDKSITLSVAIVEPSDLLTKGSFTLQSIATNIREKLALSTSALAKFEEKLELAGFRDRPEYNQDCFALKRFRHFRITADFPKIPRSALPVAVLTARYQLDLSQCYSYEIADLSNPI